MPEVTDSNGSTVHAPDSAAVFSGEAPLFRKSKKYSSSSRPGITIEELLRKLVAFPTVTNDHAANHEALNYVAQFLEQRGMHIQRFAPSRHHHESLIASTRPTNTKAPTVTLAAHMDVVPTHKSMLVMSKAGDRYIGRGVYDMKCAIAAYLKVVDELKDHLYEYDFTIMLTTDEEMNGQSDANGVREFVKEGYLPKVVCLPDGGQDWQLETSAKGILRYCLEAHGKAAHGSRPWEGENAVFKLMDALQDLRHYFKDNGPETDTFNIGTVKGGEVFNKVPHYAKAELEMRLNDQGSRKRLEAMVKELCRKHDLTATQKLVVNPIQNNLDSPLVRTFAETIKEVVGVKISGVKSYGGSDARYFADKGVPCIVFYPFGGGHHTEEEWLEVRSLEQLSQVLNLYLNRVAKQASAK